MSVIIGSPFEIVVTDWSNGENVRILRDRRFFLPSPIFIVTSQVYHSFAPSTYRPIVLVGLRVFVRRSPVVDISLKFLVVGWRCQSRKVNVCFPQLAN